MARPTARARGYTASWQKARALFLQAHPMCRMCASEGVQRLAWVVDHIIPHRGNAVRFWDQANWQSLCPEHHNSAKQQIERRGYHTRVRVDGLPSDTAHPFYRGQGDEAETTSARHAPRQPPRGPIGEGDLIGAAKGGQVEAGGPKEQGPHGYRPAELVSDFAPRGGR